MEATPDIAPDDFEQVKGGKAKRNKNTGEIWERDLLHRDHWEVYKTKKKWELGRRDRAVWNDGRLKEQFDA
jgi:hypothetical protein